MADLLKKDVLIWSELVEEDFTQLKQAMATSPVLALLDFDKLFILKTDVLIKVLV